MKPSTKSKVYHMHNGFVCNEQAESLHSASIIRVFPTPSGPLSHPHRPHRPHTETVRINYQQRRETHGQAIQAIQAKQSPSHHVHPIVHSIPLSLQLIRSSRAECGSINERNRDNEATGRKSKTSRQNNGKN